MKKIKGIIAIACSIAFLGCSSTHYTVRDGDSLYGISLKKGVSVPELMSYNNLSSTTIVEGQKLRLKGSNSSSKSRPRYHVVKKNETLYGIATRYNISVDTIKKYNNLSNNTIHVGQKVYLSSGNSKVSKPTTNIKYKSPTLNSFVRPLKSIHVNSKYGVRIHPITGKRTTHHGIDLRAPMNTPVYAPYSGVVTYSSWMNGYGKTIIIDHGKGYTTRYAHLNRWNVKKGQRIKKGQYIGKTGNTGNSTGPHLHYEIRINGKSIDPIGTLQRKK